MPRTDFDRKTFATVGNGEALHIAIDGMPLCGRYVVDNEDLPVYQESYTGFRMPTCRGCLWGLCEMITGRQMDSGVWGQHGDALIPILEEAHAKMAAHFGRTI